ncbi:MAG: hypothetical protein AB1547_02900 [Thermodesulfobacteriota bacterium]
MLETTKPFFSFWPSVRSYELGLLSFSAAEQNSPAFLRVKLEGPTFCEAIMIDGPAKRPDAVSCFIPRHCGVRFSAPHSSGFALLACGLFSKPFMFE